MVLGWSWAVLGGLGVVLGWPRRASQAQTPKPQRRNLILKNYATPDRPPPAAVMLVVVVVVVVVAVVVVVVVVVVAVVVDGFCRNSKDV